MGHAESLCGRAQRVLLVLRRRPLGACMRRPLPPFLPLRHCAARTSHNTRIALIAPPYAINKPERCVHAQAAVPPCSSSHHTAVRRCCRHTRTYALATWLPKRPAQHDDGVGSNLCCLVPDIPRRLCARRVTYASHRPPAGATRLARPPLTMNKHQEAEISCRHGKRAKAKLVIQ